MHTPVSHQTACIIPEPAEGEMETVRIERPGRRWPQPHLVINFRRRRLIRLLGYGVHPSLVGPCFHQPDIAKLAGTYKVNSVREVLHAALPLPYLYHPAMLL